MNVNNNAELPWFKYLQELRRRLIKCLIATALVFGALFPFSNSLYQLLAVPLLQQLPAGMSLIATSITATFLVPIKLLLMISLFLAAPVFLFQAWQFINTALYPHEKRSFWLILGVSLLLFLTGILFAYKIVFPLLFQFLIKTAPAGVNILPDIGDYLDFALQMFLAFGLIFQVPLVVMVLSWLNIVSVDNFVSKRPYIIVGAFVIGMMVAPPDVLSQVLLAVPLWLLFELGVWLARCLLRFQK